MLETREIRLRRLYMRSWRRGMKEMDLILGGFADDVMGSMDAESLDSHEVLMDENDQDLYLWITGAQQGPTHLRPALARVSAYLQQKHS